MSKITIEDKINNVVRKRNEIMILVRNSLMDNCTNLVIKINDLIEKNNDNPKVVKALNKEKELIRELGEEIIFAKSVDDIKKIRTKINYYMSLVRKAISEKMIDIDELEYYEYITNLREDLKEFIRCFNRKENLNKLLIKKDILSKEVKKEITYELAKERRFNKRLDLKYNKILDAYYSVDADMKELFAEDDIEDAVELVEEINKNEEDGISFEEIEELKEENNIYLEESNVEFDEIEEEVEKIEVEDGVINFENIVAEEENSIEVEDAGVDFDNIESPIVTHDIAASMSSSNSSDGVIYINSKMMQASKNYQLVQSRKYDKGVLGNIRNLVINIPAYLHNKKVLRTMKLDYANFYSGRDLKELIRLTRENNSFRYALGTIARRSYIGRKLDNNSLSFERRQNENEQLLDIIYEYRKHEFAKNRNRDLSFEKIKVNGKTRKLTYEDGGLDFASLTK